MPVTSSLPSESAARSSSLRPTASGLAFASFDAAADRFEPAQAAGGTLLIHGFTQNSNCWGSLPGELQRRIATNASPLMAVDAPGHGGSRHDRANLWIAGDLITEAQQSHLVGYSMGGRIALHTALAKPGAVTSLVLIGAHPGLADPAERSERRTVDAARAADVLENGVEDFVDRWLKAPMFDDLDPAAAQREQRLTNRAEGLAASLVHRSVACQEPLWGRLGEIAVPTLILAGEGDKKYCDIGRRAALAIGSNARFQAVPGGHAVHLTSPSLVAEAIGNFRSETQD